MALHLGDRGPHPGIDVRRGPPRPVHPQAQAQLRRGVQVAAGHGLVLGRAVGAHGRRPAHSGEPRVREHERAHEVGPGDGDLERHAAAERRADDAGGGDPQLVEQRDHVACVAGRDAVDGSPSVAGEVAAQQPVPRRERRPLRLPLPAVGDPRMEEHDRRAVAVELVLQGQG